MDFGRSVANFKIHPNEAVVQQKKVVKVFHELEKNDRLVNNHFSSMEIIWTDSQPFLSPKCSGSAIIQTKVSEIKNQWGWSTRLSLQSYPML